IFELLADLGHPAGELLIDATPLLVRLHRTTSDAAGFLDTEALRDGGDDRLLGRERGLVLRAHPCHGDHLQRCLLSQVETAERPPLPHGSLSPDLTRSARNLLLRSDSVKSLSSAG